VKPKEAIFIGHDREEIEGARRLRIWTISLKNMRVKADFFVKRFERLPKVIKRIGNHAHFP
jgi:FMN phosphatase YigB (HAD superfamily)